MSNGSNSSMNIFTRKAKTRDSEELDNSRPPHISLALGQPQRDSDEEGDNREKNGRRLDRTTHSLASPIYITSRAKRAVADVCPSTPSPDNDFVLRSGTSSHHKKLRGSERPASADRFIPNRVPGDLFSHFEVLKGMASPTPSRKQSGNENDAQLAAGDKQYEAVIRTELFPHLWDDPQTPKSIHRVFDYSVSKQNKSDFLPGPFVDSPDRELYNVMPLSRLSQALLKTPRAPHRNIPKVPYKVLDAPELQDDFYLNLVDWGDANILSVGLSACVYLWAANSSKVSKLCDLTSEGDTVTSVTWNRGGTKLAVGTNKGLVKIYDAARSEKIAEFKEHNGRVGALSWSQDLLASGSRDRSIYCYDVSRASGAVRRLHCHTQEVCGLKWNPDSTQLASGGNDNKLFVWDRNSSVPLFKLNDHTAAVKAIAWSPFNGVLASGGGTADKHIRFWNTQTGICQSAHDTGSQVCNLAWSKTDNEIVSTHGYSQNQIIVWKYPSMQQIQTLTGHSMRVLYLAMSPDGQNIVTGAGDETLRFWSIFQKGIKDTRKGIPSSLRIR